MLTNKIKSRLKIYESQDMKFIAESLLSDSLEKKELLEFISELRDENNFSVFPNESIDISFDETSKVDSTKVHELIKEIVDQKRDALFWPHEGDLIGRCKIIELAGKGYTSNVYRSIHEFLGIEVALKILSETVKTDNPGIETMFLQEARNTAKLKHPNLVSIFDADKGEKFTYMVMEFVDGVDLDKVLLNEQTLTYGQVVQIMMSLCDVLEYALDNGIIHRDIKPGNIMISRKSEVKLLDLGLSKIVKAKDSSEDGNIVGTPLYMSPEQFINSNDVDHRADIYSIGATFFHLLTGNPPFKPKTIREIISQKIVSDDYTPKLEGDFPEKLKEVINKLLTRDRDKRYQTYRELKEDLAIIKY
ncbi:serine/threonine protein kinase [bacterium]|nr:MAG: serine/threonine protein kinase [bacterium]